MQLLDRPSALVYCYAMTELIKPLLLTGMKHCGKSTVGRFLSETFSVPFEDIDELVEDLYFRENGERLSSRDIYRQGEDVFRLLESEAASACSHRAADKPLIAASGGGIIDNPAALFNFRGFCIIFISESADILFSRIISGGLPAFLPETGTYKAFLKLYSLRTAEYDKLSNITVTAAGRNADWVAEEISRLLTEKGYAR